MKPEISGRFFLVGCPRSGTTLLQCFLAAHTSVASFPESHFYVWLFGGRRWRRKLGVAGRKAKLVWNKYLSVIGHAEMQSKLPWYAITEHQYSNAFKDVLDTLTLSQGKVIWLEKTPSHICYIDRIENLVTDSKFIHIIRSGKEVIASLYDIGNRFSKEWGKDIIGDSKDKNVGKKYQNLNESINLWVSLTRMSLKYQSCENHILVNYSDLIRNPKAELVRLCHFMEIIFEEQMLTDYTKVASQVILENEIWKNNASKPIQASSSKFDDIFNDDQKKFILDSIPDDLVELYSWYR